MTIMHCRCSPSLNASLVMQYRPSLLRCSVVLSTGLPDCLNKCIGQCTATRLRLRRSLDEAMAAHMFGGDHNTEVTGLVLCHSIPLLTTHSRRAICRFSKLFHSLPIISISAPDPRRLILR